MEQLDDLIHFYEHEGKEDLRLKPQSVQHIEFRTASAYLAAYVPPRSTILDSCAGTGAYAFSLARAGHRVSAGDIVPYNVERIRAKQAKEPLLEDIFLGDARELSRFPDGAFQAVLCMGALYHLHEKHDRERVVQEGLRVLAAEGFFVCTYMNRYAVALSNVINPNVTGKDITDFLNTGIEGVFYAATPKEMEELLRTADVDLLCHVALDGPITLLAEQRLVAARQMDAFAAYHSAVCEEPHLLGSSCHNMLIGRKR